MTSRLSRTPGRSLLTEVDFICLCQVVLLSPSGMFYLQNKCVCTFRDIELVSLKDKNMRLSFISLVKLLRKFKI